MSLTGQEHFSNGASVSVNSSEVETLKQEILSEVKKEIQKAKQEIIEGIILFLSCHKLTRTKCM